MCGLPGTLAGLGITAHAGQIPDVVRAFERIELELFVEPTDGKFVWARLPPIEDALALAETAQHGA